MYDAHGQTSLALRDSRFAGYAELIAVTASGRWHLVLTFMAGTGKVPHFRSDF